MTVLRERRMAVFPRPRSLPPLCAAVKQWVSFRLPHVLSKTNSCLPSLHLKLSFSKPRGSDDGSRKFSALCGHQTQTRPRLPAQPGISDAGGCPKPTPRPRPNFLGCVTGGKARPRAHPARPLTAGLRRLSEPGAGSGRARGGPGPRGSVLPGPRDSPTGRRHGLRRDHLQDRVAAAQPRLLGEKGGSGRAPTPNLWGATRVGGGGTGPEPSALTPGGSG